MSHRSELRSDQWIAVFLCCLVHSPAHALQPLAVFLKGARQANHDNRESTATTAQRLAESDAARGRLYPVFSASGSYTRNQYEVALPANALNPNAAGMMPESGGEELVIQPHNQFDGSLTISVSLIDISAWKRLAAANATAESARAVERATQLEVETSVFRAYYQLLGQEAVLVAARRTRDVLQRNLAVVQDKQTNGTASDLDVQRSRAEIARAEGDIASANLAVVTARRQLATATSIEPEPVTTFIEDDLHDEPALDGWLNRASTVPRVTAARAAQLMAAKAAAAAEAAWLPTLSASAQERFTNATGFSGRSAVYLLQATLMWRFDATLAPTVRAQTAAANVARIRAERAQRDAQDAIFQAWHQVHAAIEKSRAARAQVNASALAAELAHDRYSVGAATQIEVLQAQQDSFRAEVSRIQADTDLAYARAALRASAGHLDERNRP